MIVSGNELYGTALKACIGAEIPRGVAEDICRATVEIAECGIDPIATLIGAVDQPGCKQLQWVYESPNWVCETGNAIGVGPSLVDFSQLVVGSGHALVKCADNLGLIYGCALAVSKTTGLTFEICFGVREAEFQDGWFTVGSANALTHIPNVASQVALRCSGTTTTASTSQPIHGLNVDGDNWDQLKKLAERILVPANEHNQADAGAGNTDND